MQQYYMAVKTVFLAGMLILSFNLPLFSQGALIALDYSISYPSADTKEYISDPSYRGISVETRSLIRPNLSAGILLGWHSFEQNSEEPVTVGNTVISGENTRRLRTYPFMLNSYFYLGKEHGFRPYLGINAGAYFIAQEVEAGGMKYDKGNWQFGVIPQAGFLAPLGWYANLHLNARYNYAFKSGESISGEGMAQSYWSFNIGLAYYFSYLF